MLNETFIEMERGAKALDLHDVSTAAVCLRKAMEGHVEMAPPGPTPPPQAVSPMAEIAKSINALEIKDFGVASLCCEKAANGLKDRLPNEVAAALALTARAIRGQDMTTAATQLRAIIRHYRPDITLPAPSEAPNVVTGVRFDAGSVETTPASTILPAPTPIIKGLPVEPALMPKF